MAPSKKVLVINEKLEVVTEHNSIKIAAIREKFNYHTFVYYISKGQVKNGVLYVMKNVWESLSDKEKEAMLRPSPDQPRPVIVKPRKSDTHSKVANHTLTYDLIGSSICTTPCPFLANKCDSEKPKVGSVNCNRCRYFVSKDKDRRQVKCGYNKTGIKGIITKPTTPCTL